MTSNFRRNCARSLAFNYCLGRALMPKRVENVLDFF